MRKIRGFKIGKRFFRISRWFSRKTRNTSGYRRLGGPRAACALRRPISKLISWGRILTSGAKKSICSGSGYVRVGEEPVKEKPVAVPKGYMAVYVGQKDGDFHRVLVPVFYFNHPLFGELLREAEEEYGFNQPGGITIPCRYAEFERVQTRIAAGAGGKKMPWKRHY